MILCKSAIIGHILVVEVKPESAEDLLWLETSHCQSLSELVGIGQPYQALCDRGKARDLRREARRKGLDVHYVSKHLGREIREEAKDIDNFQNDGEEEERGAERGQRRAERGQKEDARSADRGGGGGGGGKKKEKRAERGKREKRRARTEEEEEEEEERRTRGARRREKRSPLRGRACSGGRFRKKGGQETESGGSHPKRKDTPEGQRREPDGRRAADATWRRRNPIKGEKMAEAIQGTAQSCTEGRAQGPRRRSVDGEDGEE